MGPARYDLVEEAKVMKMNETSSGMIKAKERRGWSKRMAAHRALEKMQKGYKATRALVMMVPSRAETSPVIIRETMMAQKRQVRIVFGLPASACVDFTSCCIA